MKTLKHFISIAFAITMIGCSSSTKKSQHDLNKVAHQIPNGLYLVLSESNDLASENAHGFVVPYPHDLLDDDQLGQKTFVEIDTSAFVSLDLEKEPESNTEPGEKTNLLLTLTDSGKIQLADFTQKYLNRTVAIVINGAVVTRHKVKARIEGGKLQITRCTASGCKYLLVKLRDNLKK